MTNNHPNRSYTILGMCMVIAGVAWLYIVSRHREINMYTCPKCHAGSTTHHIGIDVPCWNCGYIQAPAQPSMKSAKADNIGSNIFITATKQPLTCPICLGDRFTVRDKMIAGKWLQTFDLEGFGDHGSMCICTSCSHVITFANNTAIEKSE